MTRVCDDPKLRGLSRGLRVLDLLESHPALSLADLHALTAVSKPSLLRILNTLEETGYAQRRIADGAWRRRTRRAFRSPSMVHDLLTEVGGQELDRLCRIVAWPSDIAVYHDGMMEILDTTARQTRFVVDRVGIGHRVHVLPTGIGRCMLAFSAEEGRQKILDDLRRSEDPFDRPARDQKYIEDILREVTANGYGARAPGYSNLPSDLSHHMTGISVPIFTGDQVIACLSLVWMAAAFTEQAIVGRHLACLKAAAQHIGQAIDRHVSGGAPSSPAA